MRKLVIFDFDGVIVNSFEAWYKINAYAFKKALGRNFTKRQYRNCYMAELNRGLKRLAGSKKNYQELRNFKKANQKELFFKYYSKVRLFPFIKFLISGLKELNTRLIIVTSSTNSLGVKKILKKFRLEKSFILAVSSEGKSKVSYLKIILKRFKFKPSYTFFITDTYNDIKWGKKAGVKTIAVLWGFHDKKTLKKAGPDFIVKNYHEIIRLCN